MADIPDPLHSPFALRLICMVPTLKGGCYIQFGTRILASQGSAIVITSDVYNVI